MGRLSKIILEGPKSHPRCLHEGEKEGVLASAEEEEGTGSQRSATIQGREAATRLMLGEAGREELSQTHLLIPDPQSSGRLHQALLSQSLLGYCDDHKS